MSYQRPDKPKYIPPYRRRIVEHSVREEDNPEPPRRDREQSGHDGFRDQRRDADPRDQRRDDFSDRRRDGSREQRELDRDHFRDRRDPDSDRGFRDQRGFKERSRDDFRERSSGRDGYRERPGHFRERSGAHDDFRERSSRDDFRERSSRDGSSRDDLREPSSRDDFRERPSRDDFKARESSRDQSSSKQDVRVAPNHIEPREERILAGGLTPKFEFYDSKVDGPRNGRQLPGQTRLVCFGDSFVGIFRLLDQRVIKVIGCKGGSAKGLNNPKSEKQYGAKIRRVMAQEVSSELIFLAAVAESAEEHAPGDARERIRASSRGESFSGGGEAPRGRGRGRGAGPGAASAAAAAVAGAASVASAGSPAGGVSPPPKLFLFMFGSVDVHFTLFYKMIMNLAGSEPNEFARSAVSGYVAFLASLAKELSLDPRRFLVCAAVPPVVPEGHFGNHLVKYLGYEAEEATILDWVKVHPNESKLEFRVRCTEIFNRELQAAVEAQGMRFVEINSEITHESGRVKPEYCTGDPTNVHISWEATFPHWRAKLKEAVDIEQHLLTDLEQSEVTYKQYKKEKKLERDVIEAKKARGEDVHAGPRATHKLRPVLKDGEWRLAYQPVDRVAPGPRPKDSDKTD